MTPATRDPFDRRLAPELFDRRFDDLVELGRSMLPRLAPGWTDHNLHDPGITLMELIAWISEAQIYSLARMRRDERAAYAALLGVHPRGPQPARGLVWPVAASPLAQSIVIAKGADARLAADESPAFQAERALLYVAGGIRALRTVLADGSVLDRTRANERGGPPFEPFGPRAGRGDGLQIDVECRSDDGLFPPRRADAAGAHIIVGVRVDNGTPPGEQDLRCEPPVESALVANGVRFPLKVVADGTRGFMQTGALVLDPAAVEGSPAAFSLQFRAPGGFARPPLVQRIQLNVLPVVQGGEIAGELHTANGQPDQILELDESGLRFGEGSPACSVTITEPARFAWKQTRDLAECGPDDRAYELDTARNRIRFGNGINGRIPPQGAQVLLAYSVCDGAAGNIARNKPWTVRGLAGVFGTNPDAMAGGQDASSPGAERREARQRSREAHPLVTASDIEQAAIDLPGLEVARAWVSPAREGNAVEQASVTLVAMRKRASAGEPEEPPETARWLGAVRRRLALRIPLGTRLVVRAPAYVDFRLRAKLEAEATLDPARVRGNVQNVLRRRLALVDSSDGPAREFGLSVSSRDLAAWILGVAGVQRIRELRLLDANGRATDGPISVPQRGLPRLDLSLSTIEVTRATPGGTP